MAAFSVQFGVQKTQAELDFVDIDVTSDMPLFLDPQVFATLRGLWAEECNNLIAHFFQSVIDAVRAEDDSKALACLSGLTEPNETHLGVTQRGQIASGRGVGSVQAAELLDRLKASEAVRSGFVSDLASCELMIDRIGPDKISDITTNIIRKKLIDYTHEQCQLHGIELVGTYPSGRWWDPDASEWRQEFVPLPTAGSERLILVPKACVRWRTSHSADEYYRNFVLDFLRQDELRRQGPLVQFRRNGAPFVTKKSLAERHPLSKDFLYRFSEQHPEVLADFKAALGRPQTISTEELAGYVDQNFSEDVFANSLRAKLAAIAGGRDGATDYHHLIVGILEFIFYPNLYGPRKEREIDDGRRRIDVTFQNGMEWGFFYREGAHADVRCAEFMVECKNYTREIANPETDQIQGRFSARRGRLGLLTCRTVENRPLLAERCRDAARDGRGYILFLEDRDINELLDMIAQRRRPQIDRIFEAQMTFLRS